MSLGLSLDPLMSNDVEASRISDADRDSKSLRERSKFVRSRKAMNEPRHGFSDAYLDLHQNGRVISRANHGEICERFGFENQLGSRTEFCRSNEYSEQPNQQGSRFTAITSIEKLPTFNGCSLNLDFLDWFDLFEDYFAAVNPPDAVMCKLVASKLKGEARIWWKELQNSRFSKAKNLITSWSRMRELLLKRFLHTSRLTWWYKQENNDNEKPSNCSIKVPIESHSSKHEVVSDLCVFDASMDVYKDISVDVLETTPTVVENGSDSSNEDEFETVNTEEPVTKLTVHESGIEGEAQNKEEPICYEEKGSDYGSSKENKEVSVKGGLSANQFAISEISIRESLSRMVLPNFVHSKHIGHSSQLSVIASLADSHNQGYGVGTRQADAKHIRKKILSLKYCLSNGRLGEHKNQFKVKKVILLYRSVNYVLALLLFDPGGTSWPGRLLSITSMSIGIFAEHISSRFSHAFRRIYPSNSTILFRDEIMFILYHPKTSDENSFQSHSLRDKDENEFTRYVGFVSLLLNPGGIFRSVIKPSTSWRHDLVALLLYVMRSNHDWGERQGPVLHQVNSSPQNSSMDFENVKHRRVALAFNRVIEVCDFEVCGMQGDDIAVIKLESFLFDPCGIPISQYFRNDPVFDRVVLFWNVIENAFAILNNAHLGDGVEVPTSFVRVEYISVPSVSKGPEDVNLRVTCSPVVLKEYFAHGPAEYFALATTHHFQLNEPEDQYSFSLKCCLTKVRLANMNVLFDPGGSLYFYGTSHLNECSRHGSNISSMITATHIVFYKNALLVVIGETKQGLVSWTNLLDVFMTALRSDKLVKGTLLGAEIKRTGEIWPTDMSVQFRMHIVLKLGKILLEMMRKSTKLTTKQSRIFMTWHYMLHLLFVGSIAQAAPILSLMVLGGSYNRGYEMTEVRKDLYHLTMTWRNRRWYVSAINHISDKTDTSRMPIAANKHSTSNGFTSAKFDKNVMGIGFCDSGHPIVKVLVFNFDLGGSQYLPIHLLHHKGVLKLKSCSLKENMKQPGLQASCYLHTSVGRLRKDKARESAHAFIPFDPGGATDHSILDIERLIIIALTELKLTKVRAIGTNLKNDSCATSCNVRPLYYVSYLLLYNFNFTRGRVKLWEGWNDVNNSSMCIMAECNIVLVWPYLSILCNKNQFRTTSEMFHKLVNGLDPPTYMNMGWMASAWILLKVRSWTSFSKQGD